MDAFVSFISYFVVAVVLLVVFMFIYVKVTPYNEYKEIANNNVAAAITFGFSFLGFFASRLPRCSPLAILVSCHDEERAAWPAAGFVDTEIGCFMKPEVAYAATTVWT